MAYGLDFANPRNFIPNEDKMAQRTAEKKERLAQKQGELGIGVGVPAVAPEALGAFNKIAISPTQFANTDGDNLLNGTVQPGDERSPGLRLAPDPKLQPNTAFDAFETKKDDSWFLDEKYGAARIKKKNQQGFQLDELRKVPRGTSTWEDTDLMGERAAKAKQDFLNRDNGIVDVNNPDAVQPNATEAYFKNLGIKDKSGGNRPIGVGLNAQGENIVEGINKPEVNANYNSFFNRGHRAKLEEKAFQAKAEKQRKQAFTDSDLDESTFYSTLNRGLKFGQGINQLAGNTAAAYLSTGNDNLTDVSDKAKVTFSNIKQKEKNLIKERYGSLENFEKIEGNESLLPKIKEDLYKTLDKNEQDLIQGKGEYFKGDLKDKDNRLSEGRVNDRLVGLIANKKFIETPEKDKEIFSDITDFVANTVIAIENAPISKLVSLPGKVYSIITEKVSNSISNYFKNDGDKKSKEHFNPQNTGDIFSRLDSQEKLDATAKSLGHGFDVGLKELINDSRTEDLAKKLGESSFERSFRYEKMNKKFKEGTLTSSEKWAFAGETAWNVVEDVGTALIHDGGSTALDVLSGSLPEMIAITVSGGGYAAPLYMNSVNQGKIAYKANHNNRDAKGHNLGKIVAMSIASTALRVGASELLVGKALGAVGKQTSMGRGLATFFRDNKIPLLQDRQLSQYTKNVDGSSRLSGFSSNFKGQQGVLSKERKELTKVIEGSKSSLLKHETKLTNLTNRLEKGNLSKRKEAKLNKEVSKTEGLIQGNKSTLKTLESKLATNKTTSGSVGSISKAAQKSKDTALNLKIQRTDIEKRLKTASESASYALKNKKADYTTKKQIEAKYQDKLDVLDSKIALNKKKADKLDNIDTNSNLNQGLNSAKEVTTKLPNFTANKLRVSLGKNGYKELSKYAKVMESSPVQLAKTLAVSSLKIAGAGLIEYGEEFGEEVFNQLRDNVGTDKKLDLNKARIAGAIGFSAGASIGIGVETLTKGTTVVGQSLGTVGTGLKITGKTIAGTAKVIGKVGKGTFNLLAPKTSQNIAGKVAGTVDTFNSIKDGIKNTANDIKGSNIVEDIKTGASNLKEAAVEGKNSILNSTNSDATVPPSAEPINKSDKEAEDVTVVEAHAEQRKVINSQIKPVGKTLNPESLKNASTNAAILNNKDNKNAVIKASNVETLTEYKEHIIDAIGIIHAEGSKPGNEGSSKQALLEDVKALTETFTEINSALVQATNSNIANTKNNSNGFDITDVTEASNSLFTLDETDSTNKKVAQESITEVLLKEPDNKVAKSGQSLFTAIEEGVTDSKTTPEFSRALESLDSLSESTSEKSNEYSASRSVVEALSSTDTKTKETALETVRELKNNHEVTSKRVDDFILKGDTNGSISIEGKEYKLGGSVESLSATLEKESKFLGKLEAYSTNLNNSNNSPSSTTKPIQQQSASNLKLQLNTAQDILKQSTDKAEIKTLTETVNSLTKEIAVKENASSSVNSGVRTKATKDNPLTTKSGDTTVNLERGLSRLARLNQSSKVKSEIAVIKEELIARGKSPNDLDKISPVTTEANKDTLVVSEGLSNKAQAAFKQANKVIGSGNIKSSVKGVASANGANFNNNSYTSDDVVAIYSPNKVNNRSGTDLNTILTNTDKVIEAGASIVLATNSDKKLNKDVTTKLKRSSYVKDSKGVYKYSPETFKGTLATSTETNVNTAIHPDIVKAEVKHMKESGVTDINSLIDWAVKTSPDPITTALVKSVQSAFGNNSLGLNVDLVQDTSFVKQSTNEVRTPAGNVSPIYNNKGKITGLRLFLNSEKGGYRAAIHELTHVVSALQIEADPKLKAELETLIESVKADPVTGNTDSVYGLKNSHEFLAELTNPEFRTLINKVVLTDSTKGNKVLDIIKRLFRKALEKITGKNYTALDKGLEILDDVLGGTLADQSAGLLNSSSPKPTNSSSSPKPIKARSSKDNSRSSHLLHSESSISNPESQHRTNRYKVNAEYVSQEADSTTSGRIEEHGIESIFKPNRNKASVFSIIKRGFRNLQEVQSIYSLNNEEVGFLRGVLKDANKFNKVLNGKLPIAITKDALTEAPILNFVKNGEMDQVIGDAMSVAGFTWLAEDMNDMLNVNEQGVQSILGNSTQSKPSRKAVEAVGQLGILEKEAVERVGNIFLNTLPISATKDAEGAVIEKLKNSAALLIISSMIEQGLIEPLQESNRELDQYRETKSKNKGAMIHFIRPKNPTKATREKINHHRSFRHTKAGIFSNPTKLVMPSTEPMTEQDVRDSESNSITSMSNTMRKGVVKNGQIAYKLNEDMNSLVDKLGESFITEMLQGDRSELTHDYWARSVEGKDLSIEHSISMFNLWKSEVKDTSIPIYNLHRMWNNIRMGIIANVINFQSSKFHRYMFAPDSWKSSFTIGDTSDVVNYTDNQGKAQKITREQIAINNINTALGLKINETIPKVIEDAVDVILSKDTYSPADLKVIQKAVTATGNKTRGLLALQNLATYTKAKQGDGKVTDMALPHEIDGITNGTSIALSQLPFSVEEAKDILRSTGVFFENDTWTTAEEYFADGHLDMYQKLTDVASSLMDMAYTDTIGTNGDTLVSFDIDGFASINNIIMPPLLKSDGTISSQGRDFTKQFLMTYIYSKGDKARIQDMKDIAIDNIYSTLGAIQTRIDEVLGTNDIFQTEEDLVASDYATQHKLNVISPFISSFIPLNDKELEAFIKDVQDRVLLQTVIKGRVKVPVKDYMSKFIEELKIVEARHTLLQRKNNPNGIKATKQNTKELDKKLDESLNRTVVILDSALSHRLHMLSGATNLLSNKQADGTINIPDYTNIKNEVKELNQAIAKIHKDALTNRNKLLNTVNKLLARSRGAKRKTNKNSILREAKLVMEDNAYLLENGSYNYSNKNKVEGNYKELLAYAKEENKKYKDNKGYKETFNIGSQQDSNPLLNQYLNHDTETLLSGLTGKVYGGAINSGLGTLLGGFEHSRALLNVGVRYASQVSYMLYQERLSRATKEEAVKQGLHPDTPVSLSRLTIKKILISMAKDGELHSLKHASSNKDVEKHVDSLLILADKLVVQKGKENKVTVKINGGITRRSPSEQKRDPKNKNGKAFSTQATMNSNVSQFEFDPDTRVKGSVNMTHSFDGNIQAAMMNSDHEINNNHDAVIVGANDAISTEQDYNKNYSDQSIEYSMMDEVEATTLRAYTNYNNFIKFVGKDSKFVKDFNKTMFEGKNALRVPLLYSEVDGGYNGRSTTKLGDKESSNDLLSLGNTFNNGYELISALSNEAEHIRVNKNVLHKDVRATGQYTNGGYSHMNTNIDANNAKINKATERGRVSNGRLKAGVLNNLDKSEITKGLLDGFDLDESFDPNEIVNKANHSINGNVQIAEFAKVQNNTISIDSLNNTVSQLGKLDVKNNVVVSDSHNRTLDTFFETSGKAILSKVNAINLKINQEHNSYSGLLSNSTLYINSGELKGNVVGQRIGSKEILAHGLSTMVWDVLVASDKGVQNDLFKILNTVTSGKDAIKPTDLLEVPLDQATDKQIKEAEVFYREVFTPKNIASFAAFASTNEKIGKLLENHKIPEILKDSKRKGSIPNYIQRVFASTVNAVFSSGKSIDERLVKMAVGINTLNNRSIIDSIGLDKLTDYSNRALKNVAVDRIYKPYSKWIQGVHDNHISKFDRTVPKLSEADKKLPEGDRGFSYFKKGNKLKFAKEGAIYTFKSAGFYGLKTVTLLGKIHDVPKLGKAIQSMVAEHDSVIANIVNDLLTEIRSGKPIEREAHELLRKAKYFSEGAAARAKSGFVTQYSSMFDQENLPNPEEQGAINNVLLKTDIQAIQDWGDVGKVLSNKEFRETAILSVEHALKKVSGKNQMYYKTNAKHLGDYMATGTINSYGLMNNAFHIVNLRSITDTNLRRRASKLSATDKLEAENLINKLATLYAINFTAQSDLDTTVKFLNSETNKVDGTESALDFLIYHHRIVQEQKEKTEKDYNEYYKAPKGYVHDTNIGNAGVKVKRLGTNTNDEILQKAVNISNGKFGIYHNKNTNSRRYQTGVMSIGNRKDNSNPSFYSLVTGDPEVRMNHQAILQREAEREGVAMLSGKEVTRPGVIPFIPDHNNNTFNNNANYSLSLRINDSSLNALETNAGNIIGNTLGDTITSNKAPKYNKELTELIYKDFSENYKGNPTDFIEFKRIRNGKGIERFKSTTASKKQLESVNILPIEMDNELKGKFGNSQSVFIRKDTFNATMGFYKVTVANNGLFNPNSTGFVKKLLTHTEKIWEAVVAKSKTNTIIYNPKVLASNTFSNGILLTTLGVPLVKTLTYQKEGLLAAIRYRRLLKDEADLKRKVNAFTKYGNREADKRKIKILGLEIKSNPVHEIVQDGLLASVVEDVVEKEAPLITSIDNAIKAFNPNHKGYASSAMDKLVNSNTLKGLPVSPMKVVKNTIITEDTEIASMLRDATQYSDFVARYALIKHRESEGVDRKTAIEEALDTFVDYDVNTNPYVQYSNDIGLFMYTKFLFRIQKVIMRVFRDNPTQALSILIGELAIGDVPDIADSNFSQGVYTPSIGDTIDSASQLNLLKYIPSF